ncbi:2-polyprenyl-6-methoxyphenol hydroxylase-like FAD-dependent oxidoreductase [Herbaspirillum sp. Sphag1AN]|uniref:FAD-dependent oxidoreductase n=1 Tax=unclassified Herbaspirillum TaxID=2624150 RepID=UPI00160E7F16|nr:MULTISPECIES: FAD-dependent oxidoreductase [unclassified Herbaspirillum]MBB3213078.1 2-polyprenyl-6-methoxyphenol hydroxylase-like FAD-dependent oxidoreductase [Herbaspirillum sp. Sphag1AN]MBB3246275.1 2-polyprenyl-6-methoxyphenol hydroxylase-like FAD-dependent oxidoreductase [Herbaspirillum sp. Sphag64]
MTEKLDVLICGAGAAGLTLAIELARRGVAFRLIEKMESPFHGSRGKGIQPRSLEIFEDIGIVDRLLTIGEAYPVQRIYADDNSYTETDGINQSQVIPGEPYGNPLLIPQFLTERVMRERLLELGHRVEFGHALLAFEQDEQGVVVQLNSSEGTETVRARYLVGTDGGRSTVRAALGIAFIGKTLAVRAVVADVVLTGLSRDAWYRFHLESMESQLSLCPLFGTELFQLQAPVPMEGDVDLSAAGLNEMICKRTGRTDIAVHAVSWASAYVMNARLAERYRVGNVFLAGDAAHIHPPTGGQGLNTSVQDAYNLGWKLAAVMHGAPATLLDSYEAERRPIAADMLGLSTTLLDAAKRGDMRRGRNVHQLDLGYPESPLSWQAIAQSDEHADQLQAGDRAPDALLYDAAGQAIRLFDAFRGVHWTLIRVGPECATVGPSAKLKVLRIDVSDGGLRDRDGAFRDIYALAPGNWVLVRPDGYIGAMFNDQHRERLGAYLAQAGVC